MKKLFIGLLIIAAAGAGVYFYLRAKQLNSPAPSPGTNKERIIGKWRADSVHSEPDDTSLFTRLLLDSNYKTTSYTFHPEGKLEATIASIPRTDTGVYIFRTDTTMVWKPEAEGPDSVTIRITKLDTAALILRTDGSQLNSTLYLTRAE
jgi:hypothetical protein